VLKESSRAVSVTFVDHDYVEEQNIPRQNFCDAELGMSKAVALAHRYGAAWGLEIAVVPERLTQDTRLLDPRNLTIIVGCVDNAAARKAISLSLKMGGKSVRMGETPRVWWLDCGNSADNGQVLLGSAPSAGHLEGAFPAGKVCRALPSPALQMPDLLVAKPEELSDKKMSCAEMMAANMQSLAINQRVAAEAADYLMRMLTGQPLKRFATYFDLKSGSARSKAITPEEVSRVIRKPIDFVQSINIAQTSGARA
jgi:PRTRC genetic system ThiF family protein